MDSRRQFLGKMTGLAGALAAPAERVLGANERVRVGVIGYGARGAELALQLQSCPNNELAAVADIYARRLEDAKRAAPSVQASADYRRLLDDPSIDAVLIATPQHLHAEHFAASLDAGKHVYQEKTMAFTVDHAKRMRAAYPMLPASVRCRSAISGLLVGPRRRRRGLPEARQRGPHHRHPDAHVPQHAARQTAVVAAGVSRHDARKHWRGNRSWAKRPQRPFDANRYVNWRFFWDYSGGNVYENMCQQMAFWYKVMNLQIPYSVTMTGGLYLWKDGREVPDTMNVSLEQPEEMLFTWDSGFGNSQLGVTEDGAGRRRDDLRGQQIRYSPQKVNRPDGDRRWPAARPPHPHAHMQNFLDCIRSGTAANCPFEIGLPRFHRLPHGRRELSSAAHRALGRGRRRDWSRSRPWISNITPEQDAAAEERSASSPKAEIAAARPGVGREPRRFPLDAITKLPASWAYMGAIFPEELGGAGLGYIEYAIIIEELSRVDGSVGIIVAAHNSLCTNHIFKAGTDEQKQRYIPKLATGEWIGCWSLTEPEAGSDAAGTRTTAVHERRPLGPERRRRLSPPTRITRDVCVAMAVTDRAAAQHGISAFIMEKGTPGFRVGQEGKQAGHARQRHRRGDLRRLPAAGIATARQARAKASSIACSMLDGGRISIAALSVGHGAGRL